MKGFSCRCGFRTLSTKRQCPRCGKEMTEAEWGDRGRILSSARLTIKNGESPQKMRVVLVAITDGPKLVCFSEDDLAVGEEAIVTQVDGKCICRRERFEADVKT